ncbi:hypothetical protein [Pendulispora albinea]|uniref:Uncharacterized protein n=1 Tax=Pendulispora albinea TaxID=2741071 RepID=A0ABZ2LRG1_9BACT
MSACSPAPLSGKVVTKVENGESRIRFPAPPGAREGDPVEFFRDTCAAVAMSAPTSPNCKMHPVGKGVVVRIVNPNEMTVRVDRGVVLRQGDAVQARGTPREPQAAMAPDAGAAPNSGTGSARVGPGAPAAADAGSQVEPEEWNDTFDAGDGPIDSEWNARTRTVVIHSMAGEPLPPIDLARAPVPRLRCLLITGIAGNATKERPTLVVFSVSFGPTTCGTMLGRSMVYRFDGRAWTHLVDTQAIELHLRANGPDRVEWKFKSAENPVDDSPWTTTALRRFPPPEPRARPERPFGFTEPTQ